MPTVPNPRYVLTAPLFITSRLLPGVTVGEATLSAEANALEFEGRAHFRFHLDIANVGEWTSADSYVTTIGRDWTHAVVRALETFCSAYAEDASTEFSDELPEPIRAWVLASASDFTLAELNLSDWLELNG